MISQILKIVEITITIDEGEQYFLGELKLKELQFILNKNYSHF